MAELNIATSGELLAPGAPGYIAALNAMGYQFGEGTPAFVFEGMPPVYAAGPDIGAPDVRPPLAQPEKSPLDPFGIITRIPGSTSTPPATRVPTPGVTGTTPTRTPVQPTGPSSSSVFDLFNGIKDRIVGFLGDSLGAVFDGITAVVSRITNVVGELASKTLPTIQELATLVASTATGALSFIADNLTDMADFGATFASALLEPLYALLDAAGEKLRDWLLNLLRSIAAAFVGVSNRLLAPSTLARPI